MAHKIQCDQFPDIWQDPPDSKDPQFKTIERQNDLHGRIYRAARTIMVKDFCASTQLPEDPKDFPGNHGQLTSSQIAQMAAVHGILLADGWDPSMGKTSASGDDLLIDAGGGKHMVVDRRFIDAVVAAVQEYTSRAALFNSCFTFLQQEGKKTTTTAETTLAQKPHNAQVTT